MAVDPHEHALAAVRRPQGFRLIGRLGTCRQRTSRHRTSVSLLHLRQSVRFLTQAAASEARSVWGEYRIF
jgi:hypothetical protein